MKRKPRRADDPIECQMELALNPGAFIPDGASFSFVSDLERKSVCTFLVHNRARRSVRPANTLAKVRIFS